MRLASPIVFSATAAAAAVLQTPNHTTIPAIEARTEAHSAPPPASNLPAPKHWGVVLYPSFESMDIIGALNPLWYLASTSFRMNLSLLSTTLDPVWISPALPEYNPMNSSFWWSMTPTHTFDTAPDDIEVLFVPGGLGGIYLGVKPHVEFIRKTYPKLRYLLSVCTGSGVVAESEALDGRNATTNKEAWGLVMAMGEDVLWRSPARWVVDGNVWSSSGVTAGQDMIFDFMEQIYGKNVTDAVVTTTEYDRARGMCDDPFAEVLGVEPTWECIDIRKGHSGTAVGH